MYIFVHCKQNEVGSFPPGKKITVVFVIGMLPAAFFFLIYTIIG